MGDYGIIEEMGISFLEVLESQLYEFCKTLVENGGIKEYPEEFSLAWRLKERLQEIIELGE